jgi:hypothetical protein
MIPDACCKATVLFLFQYLNSFRPTKVCIIQNSTSVLTSIERDSTLDTTVTLIHLQIYSYAEDKAVSRPYHGSCGQSPASHRGGPGSIQGQSTWDLWWTKWCCNRFFPEHFGFPMSISFHRCSITRKNGKNWSSLSQGCTISHKAAVRP